MKVSCIHNYFVKDTFPPKSKCFEKDPLRTRTPQGSGERSTDSILERLL